jgi:Leucine-rich repeat (LRR) protein
VHLQGLKKLEGLYLGFTDITDAGLVHLKGMTWLKRLSLMNTSLAANITDAGLVHLKALNNLTHLHLEGTKITAAGMAELQKALPNCEIDR